MKKIVPFNNVLKFETDVCEITAISLEHDIKLDDGSVSGVFYISGEYKMTDGQLDKETFKFDLPFEIALGANYDLDSLVIDIDDFRYELVGHNELKVNIDLAIDGEIIADSEDSVRMDEEIVPEAIPVTENLDFLDLVDDNKEDKVEKEEITIVNENENNNSVNIFDGFNEEENYVTYRVYRVKEGDTLDAILEKYHVSAEELGKYNVIDGIKTGDKLIIPANDK